MSYLSHYLLKVWRFLAHMGLGLLCVIFILQFGYLITKYSQYHFKAPDWLKLKITQILDEKGYRYASDDFWISLDLKLELNHLHLYEAGSKRPLINIEHVAAWVNPLPLLWGDVEFYKISIDRLSYQPHSVVEPLIKNVSAFLHINRQVCKIFFLKGFCKQVPFFFNGKFLLEDVNFFNKKSDSHLPGLDFFDGVSGLFVRGTVNTFNRVQPVLDLYFLADHYNRMPSFSVEQVRGVVHCFFKDPLEADHKVILFGKAFKWDHGVSLERPHLQAAIYWDNGASSWQVKSMKASCGRLVTPYSVLDGACLKGQQAESRLLIEGLIRDQAHWGKLDGQYHLDKKYFEGQFVINFEEHFNPLSIEHLPVFKNFKRWPRSMIKGVGHMDLNTMDFECDVCGDFNEGQWDSLVWDQAHCILNVRPQACVIKQCLIDFPTGFCDIKGHVQQKGINRLHIRGQADPTIFNPYLPSWWEMIWPPIDFFDVWPTTDLDVHFDFNDIERVRVVGLIEGQQFLYHREWIDRFRTGLYAKNQDVTLGPFLIHVGTHAATGNIRWLFDPVEPDPIVTFLDYEGHLPFHVLKTFQSAKKILDWFDCPVPPYLKLSGEAHALDPTLDKVNLKAEANAPLKYWGIGLERLYFQVQQKGLELAVMPIEFGFCGGKGIARATVLDISNEASLLNLSFNFQDIQKNQLSSQVPQLKDVAFLLAKDDEVSQSQGVIDATFVGTCPLNNIYELAGTGYVDLQTVKRVELSRISPDLSGKAVGGAQSFEIRALSTGFQLKNSVLVFDNARLSGPTTRIIVNGSYHVLNHEVDLKLQILPFAEVPILGAAFIPLRPFSKVFEVRLTGSLMNPRWSFNNF